MSDAPAFYDTLSHRLDDLRAEFESGQSLLTELDARRASTQETLLRISGAIQVLEELLHQAPDAGDDGQPAGPGTPP
jgi:hypothetical protein